MFCRSDAESMQQIPSIWMPANNQGSTTQTFREVMTMPQIYSNSQAHPFRVEMSNDGQQYMIVDRKYLPQISEGKTYMNARLIARIIMFTSFYERFRDLFYFIYLTFYYLPRCTCQSHRWQGLQIAAMATALYYFNIINNIISSFFYFK